MDENTQNTKKPNGESQNFVENSTVNKQLPTKSLLEDRKECTIDIKTSPTDPVKKVEGKVENAKMVVVGFYETALKAVQSVFRAVKNACKRFYNWISKHLFDETASGI